MSGKLTIYIKNERLVKIYGSSITVACKNAVPLEKYWRNLLKDAKIDGCVSLTKPKQVAKPKQENKDV